MKALEIYLTFNGNCEEVLDFYKEVFNGEYIMKSKFSEMPEVEGMPPVPEVAKDWIMHATLKIGESANIMASDTYGDYAKELIEGNNFSISISADSKEEADRLFEALSEGGKVIMPMADTFWDSYFGNFKDKFGITWMVSADS